MEKMHEMPLSSSFETRPRARFNSSPARREAFFNPKVIIGLIGKNCRNYIILGGSYTFLRVRLYSCFSFDSIVLRVKY